MESISVGTKIVSILEDFGVDTIFGIPGVHTIEMYRGLTTSRIRHITARHEQGAGFMADGYARVSGKPGVCLVITGPGITNVLTPMGQALADSIPLLILSTVNSISKEEKIVGPLHDLPNQEMLVKQVALASFTLKAPKDIDSIILKAFSTMLSKRPGPVHIQIPIKLLTKPAEKMNSITPKRKLRKSIPKRQIDLIRNIIDNSKDPLILIGGGAQSAKLSIKKLVEKLHCPVISTINARDILGAHPLHIPGSPSLKAVRKVIKNSDLVIAIGTELGQTDYDMYEDNLFPEFVNLVRIDIDQKQLYQSPEKTLNIEADSKTFCETMIPIIFQKENQKSQTIVDSCKSVVQLELSKNYKSSQLLIETIVNNLPDAVIVGDSTQPTYFGNLYCELSNKNRWFNSASGYGTLGYAVPASIGAKLACPEKPVICIIGDGGLQFTLTELGTAKDENIPVFFLIWNNREYKEIRTFMESKDISPIGTSPKPPKFDLIAKSFDLDYKVVKSSKQLSEALIKFRKKSKSIVIEINENQFGE